MVMFTGNVTPRAMGINIPGSALGATRRIAAGTAMYEALAARMAKMSRLASLSVTNWLTKDVRLPLKSGMSMAKQIRKAPCFLNAENRLAATIPMSNK